MKLTDEKIVLKDSRNTGRILSRIGDKWSVMVIVCIQGRARRFSEIKRGIDGISCRATINMRTRVNLDENPVWGEPVRA